MLFKFLFALLRLVDQTSKQTHYDNNIYVEREHIKAVAMPHGEKMQNVKKYDSEIYSLIKQEEQRQADKIRMIASENYVSKLVIALNNIPDYRSQQHPLLSFKQHP